MTVLRTLFIAIALAAAPAAFAQGYPNKPVRVIVTFPPGGTPDIYGRILSQELSGIWKQPVVVENRTGASGSIGADYVAKAAPDGYTLLFAADAPITIAPHLFAKIPYDPTKDFAPIINAFSGSFVLLAHPSFPPNNMKELIDLAKAEPGKVVYASSGNGGQQHLAMEVVRSMTGVQLLHIPYKGFGQGFTDVLAGQVPLIFAGITTGIAMIPSGKVKPLGVTSAKRSKALPNVPAIAETLPGFSIEAWYGFLAPPGTPREIVNKIHDDVITILKRPDFLERLAKDGNEPVGSTPEQFAAQIKADLASWGKIIKAADVKIE